MFCLLCRMHDCENPFNHQKKFNQVPAVTFKESALVGKDGHSGSQQHEMAIQREHNKRVSYFHKEFETQLQTKDSVLHHAFLSAYWLAREEIANPKFTSLLELEEILVFCLCSRLLVSCFKRAPYLFLIFLLPSKHLKIRLFGLFKKTSLSKSSKRRQQLENLLA